MSKNLNNCIEKLKFIASVKNDLLRKKLLEAFSDECMYKALNEIAKNTLEGNIKLNQYQKRNVHKYKKLLKQLTKKNNKNSMKRKLIKQSGGFLPFLIPAVASIITSLIN